MCQLTCRSIALFLALGAATPDGAWCAEPPSRDPSSSACDVVIEGNQIVELALDADGRSSIVMKQPGSRITVPRGRYRVSSVVLEGGYEARSYDPANVWFDAKAGKPVRIVVGAPLTPRVTAVRRGAVLQLKYELRDAGGRLYVPSLDRRRNEPRFEVTQHGHVLGSGSFKYG